MDRGPTPVEMSIARIMGIDASMVGLSNYLKDIGLQSNMSLGQSLLSSLGQNSGLFQPADTQLGFPFSTRGSMDDQKTSGRIRLTQEQAGLLEEAFEESIMLTPARKEELAATVGIQTRQVEVWFQNRRARSKLKRVEKDYESLKKLEEKLKKRNEELKFEIQRLKKRKIPKSEVPEVLSDDKFTLNQVTEIKEEQITRPDSTGEETNGEED